MNKWGRFRRTLDVEKPFVAIDLETSGLHPRRDHIIEVAAVRYVPGEGLTSQVQHLVKRGRRISPRIVELTGITDQMLAQDGIELCDAIDDVLAFVGQDPLVAYNADFDVSFLHNACEKVGRVVERRGGYSCALKLIKRVMPGLSSYHLPHVAARFGIPPNGSHRALSDAVRAAHVYQIARRWHLLDKEDAALR